MTTMGYSVDNPACDSSIEGLILWLPCPTYAGSLDKYIYIHTHFYSGEIHLDMRPCGVT